jgi:hypothetical protein
MPFIGIATVGIMPRAPTAARGRITGVSHNGYLRPITSDVKAF